MKKGIDKQEGIWKVTGRSLLHPKCSTFKQWHGRNPVVPLIRIFCAFIEFE